MYFRCMDVVTGATGLVGSALVVKLLKEGRSVRAMVRPGSDKTWCERVMVFHGLDPKHPSLEWAVGELEDVYSLISVFQGASHVYHAAAVVSFNPKDVASMQRVNGLGTANAINAALETGIERFIHISSTAALGRSKPGERIDESRQWEDSELNTPYAVSKYQAECEVWRGVAEGLSAVAVHPAIIIGPGRPDRSSVALLRRTAKGLSHYPTGSNGFVGVQDVANAAWIAAHEAKDLDRFVLCAANWTYRQLFENLASTLEVAPPRRVASPRKLHLARIAHKWRELLTGKPASITRTSVRNATNAVAYDGSRICGLGLEYQPLELAIDQAVAFYRLHENGA